MCTSIDSCTISRSSINMVIPAAHVSVMTHHVSDSAPLEIRDVQKACYSCSKLAHIAGVDAVLVWEGVQHILQNPHCHTHCRK